MRYAVLIDYTDMEARNRALEAHRAFLAAGREQGSVIESGPFADGKGGMYIIEMPDEAAAKSFVARDPYQTEAKLKMTIREWKSTTATH
jgi:uncharacterized protein YciI